jgi:hypothetical protein
MSLNSDIKLSSDEYIDVDFSESKNTSLTEIKQEISLILDKQVSVDQMLTWYNDFKKFVVSILKERVDYGKVPLNKEQTRWSKEILFKPGAEKLRMAYGLSLDMQCIERIEDRKEGYCDYTFKYIAYKNGYKVAEAEGSANNKEKGAQNQYQTMFDVKNSVLKKAQKRAYVACILQATGASEFFTQDLEEMKNVFLEEDSCDNKIIAKQKPEPKNFEDQIADLWTFGQLNGFYKAHKEELDKAPNLMQLLKDRKEVVYVEYFDNFNRELDELTDDNQVIELKDRYKVLHQNIEYTKLMDDLMETKLGQIIKAKSAAKAEARAKAKKAMEAVETLDSEPIPS